METPPNTDASDASNPYHDAVRGILTAFLHEFHLPGEADPLTVERWTDRLRPHLDRWHHGRIADSMADAEAWDGADRRQRERWAA